jgi:hypothetical protein
MLNYLNELEMTVRKYEEMYEKMCYFMRFLTAQVRPHGPSISQEQQ